jgi:hypothetical protein
MATFVPTVTSDTNRKGVAFTNNTGTIAHASTLNITGDFTLSYAVKQLSNDSAHFCKGEPEDPSIASGMIYTECKSRKLRIVLFDSNGTDVLSIITDNPVLASNKSKVIQIRYKQSTDLLEIFIDGVQVNYMIETSELYYHANVSGLTGIFNNSTAMTFGSASGKTDFDGILYGGVLDLEYLNNTDLTIEYNKLKDVVTNLDSYQQIVFVSNRSGSIKIHEMSEDGNDAIILNSSFVSPIYLKYNNASNKITLTETISNHIRTIDSNGNVLSDPIPSGLAPRWSSYALDGSDICVYTDQNGSFSEIYYSIAGATPVATGLLTGDIASPQITADGNYLIWSNISQAKIQRVDFPSLANLTNLYTASFALYNCVLSRDGNYIGFTQVDASGYEQLFKMGIGGGSPIQLTTGSNSKFFHDFNDNSTKILYSENNGVVSQLKTMNIDGTNIQNISNNSFNEIWGVFKPIV